MVLFHYEKERDDELTLEVGDVITDVKQVCTVSKPLLRTTVYGTTCRLQQKMLHDFVIEKNMEHVAPCIVVVAADLHSVVGVPMCMMHYNHYHANLRLM